MALDAGLIIVLGLVAPAAIRLGPVHLRPGASAAGAYLVAAQLAFDGGTVLAVVYRSSPSGWRRWGASASTTFLPRWGGARHATCSPASCPSRWSTRCSLARVRTSASVGFGASAPSCSAMCAASPPSVRTAARSGNRCPQPLPERDERRDHGPRGTLVAYMGDRIMAVFGAPLEAGSRGPRGCSGQGDARAEAGRFNARLREQRLGSGFRMGVRLNTGPVMSGQVGSSRRVGTPRLGTSCPHAARLEGMTKGDPVPTLRQRVHAHGAHRPGRRARLRGGVRGSRSRGEAAGVGARGVGALGPLAALSSRGDQRVSGQIAASLRAVGAVFGDGPT